MIIKSHKRAQNCRYHEHNRTEIVGYQNDSEGRLPPPNIEYKESVPGNLPKQDGGNHQLNGYTDQPDDTLCPSLVLSYNGQSGCAAGDKVGGNNNDCL